MMENNFTFSKTLLHFAISRKIPFVYASSAAVYGASRNFTAERENERPLNLYALSKLAFDHHVRANLANFDSTVVGLRYFNVYGPREAHKKKMASMPYQLYRQLQETGRARLFKGTDGYADGDQRRDFVFVGDVVRVNRAFATGPVRHGIFNVGTGHARTFNDVANGLIRQIGTGSIEYVPFPESLAGRYQSYTEADLTSLRDGGYEAAFTNLEDGIASSVAAWDRETN
jgi:ADP-L-glycero-D-manno-heptose 6-epimerase